MNRLNPPPAGFLLALAVFLSLPHAVEGQRLRPGVEIRVRQAARPGQTSRTTDPAQRRWTRATLIRLTSDTIWYRVDGSVSARSLGEEEVQTQDNDNQRRAGLMVGAVLGAVAGAALGAAMSPGEQYYTTYPDSDCPTTWSTGWCDQGAPQRVKDGNTSTDDIIGGAIGGALISGALGYVIGTQVRKWETVDFQAEPVGLGGLGLVLSVSR